MADVVGSGEEDKHFRIYSFEFAVLEPPQDIFCFVAAPAKIRRVPAEEVVFPVGKEIRIIGGSPAAGDGVALKIDVDVFFFRVVQ